MNILPKDKIQIFTALVGVASLVLYVYWFFAEKTFRLDFERSPEHQQLAMRQYLIYGIAMYMLYAALCTAAFLSLGRSSQLFMYKASIILIVCYLIYVSFSVFLGKLALPRISPLKHPDYFLAGLVALSLIGQILAKRADIALKYVNIVACSLIFLYLLDLPNLMTHLKPPPDSWTFYTPYYAVSADDYELKRLLHSYEIEQRLENQTPPVLFTIYAVIYVLLNAKRKE